MRRPLYRTQVRIMIEAAFVPTTSIVATKFESTSTLDARSRGETRAEVAMKPFESI